MGRRVMVTGRASNPRREGSIPSRPAERGDSSTGEHCIRMAEIGVRFPVAPPSIGAVAQRGERLDGIEEVAGASPAGSTSCGYRPNSRTPVFQTENEGASPSARSRGPQSRGPRPSEPILRGGSPSATRRTRVRLPLGSPTDHDGLVTLGSLIRSLHCVRFAGDPRRAALAV